MAQIDSLLNLVHQQGADELRLGTDRAPAMFAQGTPKRLVIPPTSADTLRDLLGDMLSPERCMMARQQGRAEFVYDAAGLGSFKVTVTGRASCEDALDVVFLRATARPSPTAAQSPAKAVPAPMPVPARAPIAPATGGGISAELGTMLARAVAMRASDVHLAADTSPMLRVDGKLRPLAAEPVGQLESLLGDAFDGAARDRIDAGSSVDLATEVPGVGRFRINVYVAGGSLAAAVRLLPAGAPALGELGLPVSLDNLVELPHGLVIVCGPTGSGKSTTLAALAQEALKRRSVMLIGLEDPIEYRLSDRAGGLVRQRQIGRDVRDFATGLRDALREDPDVLLIGEMRDPETIGLALTAAETGHLVLTSLHSRSAPSAIERIVDTYPAERQQQIRVQLADALRAVVAQRLLPRAKGSGRAVALEVLRVNTSVGSHIRDGKTAHIQSTMQAGRKDGMITLERCLADLVRAGSVTLDAARAVANDGATLTGYLSG